MCPFIWTSNVVGVCKFYRNCPPYILYANHSNSCNRIFKFDVHFLSSLSVVSTLRNMNCGAQSNFAASEMRNPTRLTGNCVYTIRANSLRVCQLRIDIDTLMLAQPEVTTSRNYMHCIHDALSVDGVEICGTNMATHGNFFLST